MLLINGKILKTLREMAVPEWVDTSVRVCLELAKYDISH